MAEVASAFVTLIPSFKGGGKAIQKEIDGAAGSAGVSGGKKAGKGFGSGFVGGVGKLAGPLAAAFAVPAVIGGLNSLANKASDLNETVNKSSVIFGKNAGSIDKWAQGAAKNMGLSRQAALEAAAGFGDMFTQIGFSGDEAAKMSKGVVQMSADLGSFNNLPTEDVSQRIAAAFRGEYDSLQALIPNINAARVEKEALATTGKKNAKSLTAEEKAAAVLAIVNKDGARAMGDFAKTSDGAANKAKIQAARFEDLKTKAGGVLLPVKQLALDGFGALITFGERLGPVFQKIGNFLKPAGEALKVFFSFLGGNDTGVDGPFREMAVAGEFLFKVISTLKLGFSGLIDGFRDGAVSTDGFVGKMMELGKWIKLNVVPAVQSIVAAVRGFIAVALPIVQQFVAGMRARIEPLMPQIRAVFTTIGTIIAGALELVRAVIARVTTIISAIWSRWGTQIMDFVAKVFGAVIQIIGGVMKVVAGIIKTVTSLIKGDWSGAWNGIKQILAGVWQAIKGIISGALTIIKATIAVAWTAIKAGVSAAWDKIKSAVSTGIGKVVTAVKELPGKATSALGDLGSKLFGAGAALVQGLIDGIASKIRAIKDKVGEVAQAIKDFFPGSPVKTGPLTSWNNGGAGKRLGGMLADGLDASRAQVAAASRGVAGQVALDGVGGAGARGTGQSGAGLIQALQTALERAHLDARISAGSVDTALAGGYR